MSYLKKQQQSFNANLASVSTKISNKRTIGNISKDNPVTSAPSPSPSNASATSRTENRVSRVKVETPAANVVYSQPVDSGVGSELGTQVQYIIKYLKEKDEPKSLKDIVAYLGIPRLHHDQKHRQDLAHILRTRHKGIRWMADPADNSHEWDAGLFYFQPVLDVRNSTDLLGYLQKKDDFMGTTVKDLKDGWDDAEEGIAKLEAQHKILVTRTKKDSHPRLVWSDDPTLYHPVDNEFLTMWRTMELPPPDDVVMKLIAQGQKPASEDPSKRAKVEAKPKAKKKRAPRANTKTTNTHMQHLLRDYPSKN